MTFNNKQKFLKKKLPVWIHFATSVSLVVGAAGMSLPVLAQDEVVDEDIEEIFVSGQRASIESARDIKRNADAIVDSIVAEDIGKLPDRSVAEALQRISGVSVSRFDNPGDPEHFAGEGAGVSIRGLPQVRAELNGRDIFSADGGRGLSFEDVPAELMAGVDVYKSPTADMIEGGLGGIVNLRTRMPFDSAGQIVSFTARANYGDIIKETNGEFSGLYSNRWETEIGELGFLINLSTSSTSSRADNVLIRAFHPRSAEFNNEIEPGQTVWVPRGADWRRNDYESDRDGQYVAAQYAPNDDLEFKLTAFRSKAERGWLEHAFFIDAGGGFDSFLPSKGADDWVYDSNNALVSGTITTAQGNGVPFGTSTRIQANTAETRDVSFGMEWQATERLNVTADIQRVDSTSGGKDFTLGLVAFPESIVVGNLNTRSGTPSISIPGDYLSNSANFSYGQMMSLPSDNEAESTAARIDLDYDFESSLITSVKAGVRFSEKSAINRSGNNWSANYQPWQVGSSWQPFPDTASLPKIQDGLYVTNFSFEDFQRGDTQVPTSGVLIDASLLNDYASITSALIAASPGGATAEIDFDALDLTNPNNINTQDEETTAVYLRADFDFEQWNVPITGNVGIRYVETKNTARGQLSFPTFTVQETDPDTGEVTSIRPFFSEDVAYDADSSYSNFLPSMNLRWTPNENAVLRFSAARGIWRPEFWRMKALLNLSASFKEGIQEPETIAEFTPDMVDFFLDSGGTNPYLEPMEADQYDLTAEWYTEGGSFAYVGVFTKKVKDFFRTSTTQINEIENFPDVTSTLTVNTGKATVDGIEVGGTWFFDSIPALDGFGIQANYTLLDSNTKVSLDTEPVDTDGSAYGSLPLEGLSEKTFNISLMYDKNGWWARLAHTWRSEHLLAIGANGFNGNTDGVTWRLPVFADDYGQWDLMFGYRFNDNISINFEVYNIGQAETRGFFQQTGAGDHTAFVNTQDTRYGANLRFTF